MKIAILGFGKEGQSAFRYWSRKGCQMTIHDNNELISVPQNTQTVLGKNAFKNLDNFDYDLLVRSPGVRIEPNKFKTKITSVTKEFFSQCPAPIIGVTGTKGKGTTATLISKILVANGLKTHLIGNIGNPALDELNKISSNDYVVYEMSSFQLFDLDISPHIAVCLMISDDHLDWHKTVQEYHEAKGNIFKFQNQNDIAVFKQDDSVTSQLASRSPARTKISYWINGDVCLTNQYINAFGENIIKTSEIALPGKHNLQNICAAIAASWSISQNVEKIKQVLKNFQGLPFHIELILKKNNITYYNDSFSTNPTAAIAAVESFSNPLVLFFGGFDKSADFNELAEVVSKHQIRQIICYGQTGRKIFEIFQKHGIQNVKLISNKNFNQIVQIGLRAAKPGDVVLFSPACASWDMFEDYKSRGTQFNSIVFSNTATLPD